MFSLLRTTLLAVSFPALAVAQVGGFVTMLGKDTVSVERYERTANRIDGQIVRRSPQTSVLRYSLTFNADGSVASYEQAILRADGSAAPNSSPQRMTFTTDSVMRQVMQNGQSTTLRSPAPKGTLPGIGGSTLATELVLATTRRLGAAYLIGFAAQQAAPNKVDVRFMGSDSAEVIAGGFRTGFKLGSNGQVLRSDGSLTTQKFISTPAPAVNIGTIASGWAARDAAGQAAGAASTRDTLRVTIGAANVTIDYGRPAARGREIWGKLVPFDTTWRFGANAATQLTTDRDLMFGNIHVSAGKYTLFLYPTANAAWLIVNKQTGQWGTAYDKAQDLVRIPLELHMNLPTPEERFRIFVAGDKLMMHWDRGGYGVKIGAM
jgi:hypothetical protein